GLRRVLIEGGLQARQGALASGQADSVDGEVVDEARVEVVLGVSPRADARRRLHRVTEDLTERVDVAREHRLIAEIARDLGKAGEQLVDGHGAGITGGSHMGGHVDLHAPPPRRLYRPTAAGPPSVYVRGPYVPLPRARARR